MACTTVWPRSARSCFGTVSRFGRPRLLATGEIQPSRQDAEIYSGVDYDSLVLQGIYTREEADLQRDLDCVLVPRSLALESETEEGEDHEH